jgi:hypothetical protein
MTICQLRALQYFSVSSLPRKPEITNQRVPLKLRRLRRASHPKWVCSRQSDARAVEAFSHQNVEKIGAVATSVRNHGGDVLSADVKLLVVLGTQF